MSKTTDQAKFNHGDETAHEVYRVFGAVLTVTNEFVVSFKSTHYLYKFIPTFYWNSNNVDSLFDVPMGIEPE